MTSDKISIRDRVAAQDRVIERLAACAKEADAQGEKHVAEYVRAVVRQLRQRWGVTEHKAGEL